MIGSGNSPIDTAAILVLISIPAVLSIILVGLAIWTNRTVTAIHAMQERKAAESAIRDAAVATETARAEMERRLTQQIERERE